MKINLFTKFTYRYTLGIQKSVMVQRELVTTNPLIKSKYNKYQNHSFC